MPDDEPYCVGAPWHDGEPKAVLASFDAVREYLSAERNAWADEYAEVCIAHPEAVGDLPVGGPGIWLRNRWGHEVEVGVGRDVWFLIRIQPKPSAVFSDAPEQAGPLVFYLAGGHYTDIGPSRLVRKAAALDAIRGWLDTGMFPPSRSPAAG